MKKLGNVDAGMIQSREKINQKFRDYENAHNRERIKRENQIDAERLAFFLYRKGIVSRKVAFEKCESREDWDNQIVGLKAENEGAIPDVWLQELYYSGLFETMTKTWGS